MERLVAWNKNAIEKLQSISNYLEENWSEKEVKTYHQQIQKVLKIIATFPEAGNLEYVKRSIRSFRVNKRTKLVYRITEKEIIVLNIFDYRQHPTKKLK